MHPIMIHSMIEKIENISSQMGHIKISFFKTQLAGLPNLSPQTFYHFQRYVAA
jgi:hypothetical protein